VLAKNVKKFTKGPPSLPIYPHQEDGIQVIPRGRPSQFGCSATRRHHIYYLENRLSHVSRRRRAWVLKNLEEADDEIKPHGNSRVGFESRSGNLRSTLERALRYGATEPPCLGDDGGSQRRPSSGYDQPIETKSEALSIAENSELYVDVN
jgi:hypothetical protein